MYSVWLLGAAVVSLFCRGWFLLSVPSVAGRYISADVLGYAVRQRAQIVFGFAALLAAACYGRGVMSALKEGRLLSHATAWALVSLAAVLFMPASAGMHASIPLVACKATPAIFAGFLLQVFVSIRLEKQRDLSDSLLAVDIIAAVGLTLILIMLGGQITLPAILLFAILAISAGEKPGAVTASPATAAVAAGSATEYACVPWRGNHNGKDLAVVIIYKGRGLEG